MVTITTIDATYMRVEAEPHILMEMRDAFSFYVKGYQFQPAFRAKMWDGKIYLMNAFQKRMYVGLWRKLEDWCRRNEYPFVNNLTQVGDEVGAEEFIDTLRVSSGGKNILIRDYQRAAFLTGIKEQRQLLLSPTGSGKSLILYSLMRWHVQHHRKVLLIVPTVQLVSQMFTDFEDYSEGNKWSVKDNCQKIMAGMTKEITKNVSISTWQSLAKLPPEYFKQFDVVFSDECHLAAAKTLTGILEKCTNAHYRIGTTGTLDGSKTNEMVLQGLIGPVMKVTTTKKLMDEDRLSNLDITCLTLSYSDSDRKALKKITYKEEVDWLVSHPKRNNFIVNLSLNMKGNTLVLFQYVEKHGKVLYELAKGKASGGRQLFFIHGGVEAEDREYVRQLIETENDVVIFASVQTTSTGVNFKNLHNIIFPSPTKSRVRSLQSIGRGLRKSANKTTCKLFDIGDDLTWKSYQNHTYKHMIERLKFFNEEEFEYKTVKVDIT